MMDDDLVEKLHGMLAEALHRVRPEPFASPVTVAEMYQDLVPYRSVRTALGFQMNADYEHTLLRLLAGEGGFAKLEPSEARDELSAELETPNPNVGLFRKFAACDVWITAAAAPIGTPTTAALDFSTLTISPTPVIEQKPPAPAAAAPPPPQATPSVAMPGVPAARFETNDKKSTVPEPNEEEWDSLETELLLEEEVEAPDTSVQAVQPVMKPPQPKEKAQAPMFETKASPASVAEPSHSGSCAFCRNGLPAGRMVRYCPFCGSDQSLKPCASCREPLEPSWKFCISCGTRQN